MKQEKPLSASALKSLAKSPELCYARHLDPERQYKSSPAAELGSLIHELILEPQAGTYVAMPEGMARRGKEYQSLLESARGEGKTLVTHKDYENALRISEGAKHFSDVLDICEHSQTEFRATWNSPGTPPALATWMVAIFDYINPSRKRVVDVKTTSQMDRLDKVAMDGRWDIQQAVYLEGASMLFNVPQSEIEMSFVVLETVEPYRSRLVTLDYQQVENGKASMQELRREYRRRLRDNDWVGDRVVSNLSFPSWFGRTK